MARNLIRPLESRHNFTQSGWLILISLSGQHKLGKATKTLFLPQNFFVQDRRLTVCSLIAAAAAASHHHEGRRLIHGPLASILLDQGFPVEYELDEFNSPYTGTTLCRLQYWLCRLRCKISFRHLATSFLGTFTLLSETTRTTNSRWLQSFLSSNSKHDFCYTMANISPSHIQQCLNLTMHFSLRNLAAKMLSQLYNNYYVHFRTNALGKYEPSPLPPPKSNTIPAVLLQGWFWHEITQKGWYAIKETETKTGRRPPTIPISLNKPGNKLIENMSGVQKYIDVVININQSVIL